MTTATEHQFRLPITTDKNLKTFIDLAFGIQIPDKQICPHHATPWQAFADAYFARSPVAVWKASRAFGGKSFLLALLGLTEAITLKTDVNILGGSGEQSRRVHGYMEDFWRHESAPRQLLASDPLKRETRLAWGNVIQALLASQTSVRGPHVSRLRLDEIDELDIKILDAALGQTMSMDGVPAQTVLSSTHQYAAGTMTEILQRATEKGWSVFEWCWKETVQPHGWLPASEIERKKNEVTAVMWDVEFDLQEPSPESRAILPEKVKAMFKAELGTFEGRNGEYIEIESPQEGARYSTGADWAKKVDWTIVITLRKDVNPMRLVAFERMGREPWPLMVGKFDERMERYGGDGAHDGTGLGDVVDGYMTSDATSVIMAGRARSDLLSNYISGIERGEIESPVIKFMQGEHRYASVDDVYGGGKGAHLPDTIAAGALAYGGGSTWSFG